MGITKKEFLIYMVIAIFYLLIAYTVYAYEEKPSDEPSVTIEWVTPYEATEPVSL